MGLFRHGGRIFEWRGVWLSGFLVALFAHGEWIWHCEPGSGWGVGRMGLVGSFRGGWMWLGVRGVGSRRELAQLTAGLVARMGLFPQE